MGKINANFQVLHCPYRPYMSSDLWKQVNLDLIAGHSCLQKSESIIDKTACKKKDKGTVTIAITCIFSNTNRNFIKKNKHKNQKKKKKKKTQLDKLEGLLDYFANHAATLLNLMSQCCSPLFQTGKTFGTSCLFPWLPNPL